jgi:hypothetical protein
MGNDRKATGIGCLSGGSYQYREYTIVPDAGHYI